MIVNPQQIGVHVKGVLAPVYLVFGDETLLVEESVDAIHHCARSQGFDERRVYTVDPRFDWGQLTQDCHTGSLFSQRRVVELRIANGRPGDVGGGVLTQWAEQPPEDILLLVVCGRLDKSARQSRWFKALDGVGVNVPCWPVAEDKIPDWIGRRLKSRGLIAQPGVIEELAYYLSGNLLGIAQEIDKLDLLCPDRSIDLATTRSSIADNARFDVYALVDACLLGQASKALRVIHNLRAEGTEPVLALWALRREVHALQAIACEIAAGRSRAQVFKAHRVWSQRAPKVGAALSRFSASAWLGMIQWVARLDRVLKGRRDGDIWLELERFSLRLCGLKPL
ncbi:MAG TPA: DNA polymerase III subunit delta [Acidiferrobacteraceae bacterium]|nr:DNA polymerase III subunit delta [Acidiferrobacteraceae bacterium]